MARYVVTGGAGFIGTNLCLALRAAGHEVIAFDNLSVSDANLPILSAAGVTFVEGDLMDLPALQRVMKGVDCVFHLAAMNRAQRSIEQPITAHHANATGTLHVLEAMRSDNVPKIVFTSSSSVYAGREGLLSEVGLVSPPHPYGVGKLASEHYVRVYGELFGVKGVTLRLFSVYGPYQLGSIDKAGVVAKHIHFARTNKPLPIYGDGSQLRNFTYVADVVRSLILASESTAAEGRIINIANPDEISVKRLAEIVLDITGAHVGIAREPALKGDPARNPADISAAKQILKYVPTVTFEDGIRKTVEWYDKAHGTQKH